ncbi:MAG: Ni/Fe hydrogenase subunit alpha [Candidatus Bathyarchaeia archaeon]
MSLSLSIDPLTRVEGGGRVKIEVRDGEIKDLQFLTMSSPRFFEFLLLNKQAEDAPRISERICGICYVNHHLVSVKAVEDAWGIEIPQTAVMLRRVLNAGSFITSHSLHLAFLALPDLLGLDELNFIGLAKKYPDLAKKAIQIHEYGNRVVREIGGRLIHPVTAVPGGMTKALSGDARLSLLVEGRQALNNLKSFMEPIFELYEKRVNNPLEYMAVETPHMGLVRNGEHELYDGSVRVMSERGETAYEFNPENYRDYLEEAVSDHSYTKLPYLKSKGYPEGALRVGPLSRINVIDSMPWTEARGYLKDYDKLFKRPVHDAAAYNLARAIETVAAAEECIHYLSDDQIVSTDTRVTVKSKPGEGVGIAEAPRGILLHNYRIDEDGLIRYVNIIAPTTFNHPVIERNLRLWAETHVEELKNDETREQALWSIEKIVRAYDPCLSCSVHTITMDLIIDGESYSSRRVGKP